MKRVAAFLVGCALLFHGGNLAQSQRFEKFFAFQAQLWTPSLLGNASQGGDAYQWFNADDGANPSLMTIIAGAVSQWCDRLSATCLTAAGSAQPTWSTSGFPVVAKPVVTCDGVANTLATTNFPNVPNGSTASELWLITNYNGGLAAQSQIAVDYGALAGATRRRVQFGGSAVNPLYRISDGATNTTNTLAFPSIAGGNWSGTTMAGSSNGTTINTATVASLSTGTTRFRICSANGNAAGNFYNGGVRHILLTKTLSASIRQKMQGWGACDINRQDLLPAIHPYRSTCPTTVN